MFGDTHEPLLQFNICMIIMAASGHADLRNWYSTRLYLYCCPDPVMLFTTSYASHAVASFFLN
jgi:hypothetical protein